MKILKSKSLALLTLSIAMLTACGGGTVSTNSNNASTNSVVNSVTATGIRLSEEAIALNAGESKKLEAILSPEGANASIKWETSDSNVATVSSDGTVTAINLGEATILAKVDGTNYVAECSVSVSGYFMSEKIFNGFYRFENNSYNSEDGYKAFNVDALSSDEYVTIKFNRKETREWASLTCYYFTEMTANEFNFEIELVKGNLPNVMFEFSGDNNFKFYERVPLVKGEKIAVNLNITDINLKTGEGGNGSWGSVFIEPNNPLDNDDKYREDTEEVELRLYKMAFSEGEKKAPEKIKNIQYDEEKCRVTFDKNYASTDYDIEVYKVDNGIDTKLELDVRPTRFQAFENIPNMKYMFVPKTEENFANIEGTYKARVRGKNTVGEGEWSDFVEFTIGNSTKFNYETEGFANDGKIEPNPWNDASQEFKVEQTENGYLLKFTGAEGNVIWNSYMLTFDKNVAYKKLHMEFEILKGNISKVELEFADWAETEPEASDGKQQVERNVVQGKNTIDLDITVDLSKGNGQFFFKPAKEGAVIGECEILVTSMKLLTE